MIFLTEEEIQIILNNTPKRAAFLLGYHVDNVRNYKRSIKNGHHPRRHETLSEDELRIIKINSPRKAAEMLGRSVNKISYYKRRIREGKIDIVKNESIPIPNSWQPKYDEIIRQKLSLQPIAIEPISESNNEPVNLKLEAAKAKIKLHDILKQFPKLLPNQIEQMKSIYSYSPKSAIRYCQNIQQWIERKRNQEAQEKA